MPDQEEVVKEMRGLMKAARLATINELGQIPSQDFIVALITAHALSQVAFELMNIGNCIVEKRNE